MIEENIANEMKCKINKSYLFTHKRHDSLKIVGFFVNNDLEYEKIYCLAVSFDSANRRLNNRYFIYDLSVTYRVAPPGDAPGWILCYNYKNITWCYTEIDRNGIVYDINYYKNLWNNNCRDYRYIIL